MKNRVDLFSIDLLPPEVRPSLKQVVITTVILSLILVSYAAYMFVTMTNNEKESARLIEEENSLIKTKGNKETELARLTIKDSLRQEILTLEQRIKLRELYLKAAKENKDMFISEGYSSFLTDIASITSPKIWLTRFVAEKGIYQFEGAAASPDSIPEWIKRLESANTFTSKGISFDSLVLSQDDKGSLTFKLTNSSSGKDVSKKKGSK